jgi:hypothetical protein
MVKVGGIVLAAATGQAAASGVCDKDSYYYVIGGVKSSPSNLMDNLVVAAVIDAYNAAAGTAATVAEIKAEFTADLAATAVATGATQNVEAIITALDAAATVAEGLAGDSVTAYSAVFSLSGTGDESAADEGAAVTAALLAAYNAASASASVQAAITGLTSGAGAYATGGGKTAAANAAYSAAIAAALGVKVVEDAAATAARASSDAALAKAELEKIGFDIDVIEPLAANLVAGRFTAGLTSNTVPKLNPAVVAMLPATPTGCGSCAYSFYKSVFAAVTEAAGSAVKCGLFTTNPTLFTELTYANWGQTSSLGETGGWAKSLTADIMNAAECISTIQPAIDAFNRCAGNGMDIKTAELNKICMPTDLRNLDGTYGVYNTVMTKALVGTAYTTAFSGAYSGLACRSCIDAFETAIKAENTGSNANALYDSATPSGTPKCQDDSTPWAFNPYQATNAADCLHSSGSVVTAALDDFQVCAGASYMVNKKKRQPVTDTQKTLINALKPYEAIVRCSVIDANDISGSPTADELAAWETCMTGYSPLFDFNTQSSLSAPTVGPAVCLKALATGVQQGGPTGVCTSAYDVFDDAATKCIDMLNKTDMAYSGAYASDTASSLIQFFQCSGVDLDLEKTTCSTTEIAAISSIHKSYVPVIEIAMGAAGTGDAGAAAAVTAIMADTDLWAGVGDVPCRSCYAKLAAELKHEMTTDDKNLCSNPYSTECKSTRVAAALARFKTCSGFDLTSAAANTCTSAEWDIMRNAKLQANTFNLLLPSVSATLTQAQFHLAELMTTLKAANPTKTFRCDHCYEVLVNDLYSLSLANKQICQANIGSGACFAVASSAFTKFATCSGFTFDFSAVTTTTTTTTTLAPGSTESTTSDAPVDPETTKAASTSQFASVVMASLVAIMAL